MKEVGDFLTREGFEFLAVNSKPKKDPQFICIKNQKLHIQGTSSVFATISTTGGGGGGDFDSAPSSGGSGGGGSSGTGTTGNQNGAVGTTGQGFSGGTATRGVTYGGAGGGGAGASGGSPGASGNGGNGGAGKSSSITGSYLHSNNKIGCIVSLEGGSHDLAIDIAMHAAATDPLAVSPDDIPSELVEKEREI